MEQEYEHRFWNRNLRLIAGLLLTWILITVGCGGLLMDQLNAVSLGELGLGSWIAQQGSIYLFLLFLFIYMLVMGRFERNFWLEKR